MEGSRPLVAWASGVRRSKISGREPEKMNGSRTAKPVSEVESTTLRSEQKA